MFQEDVAVVRGIYEACGSDAAIRRPFSSTCTRRPRFVSANGRRGAGATMARGVWGEFLCELARVIKADVDPAELVGCARSKVRQTRRNFEAHRARLNV